MAAPERFADMPDFLLHCGRRPYMAHRVIRCVAIRSLAIGRTADNRRLPTSSVTFGTKVGVGPFCSVCRC
jgi:hypothetical protein